MEDMKLRIAIFIFMMLFLNIYVSSAAENEYGIVKAWFNEKNATVEGIQLKIDEPAEIKVMVISKIKGDVSLQLYEPGVTRAFKITNGPSDIEKWIDNLNIESGWSKTYTWTIAPNGAWTNGNAPINLIVQFNKEMEDKRIHFTIANPHILDEQYPGSGSTPAQTSGITPGATEPKEAPFVPLIAALAVMIMIYLGKRR